MAKSSREQQLVDIAFQMVLTVLDKEFHKNFYRMTKEQQAAWVARQLDGCGFPTKPVGSSWGVLQ